MCMLAYGLGGRCGCCPLLWTEDWLFQADSKLSQGWSGAQAVRTALPGSYPTSGHKE